MAKVKNKRNSGLADKVHNKKKSEINKKKLNPFEVHINREKLKVLGKKSKHDRGLPGVSRAKAIQKRKETLGTEMKLMNKTNAFIDRRIGEKSTQLSAEERMVARFAAERVKQHNKKNIYNLADDEVLTHRGQTLEQIEKFDDPRSDDEEDEDGRKFGGLGDEFVADGHFGGGMLSKTDSKDGAKSHKDLIEQLIAESKKRKAEKQKEKEQTLDLTEKLDSEWKDLQPVVFKKMRTEESAIEKLLSQAEKKNMDYDKMMRELKFEKRGTPSDGLKNDEKQAKEERARLEQLEKERELRMMGEEEQIAVKSKQAKVKHRSAEDLDDNFELDDEHDFMLAYDKDGKPLVPEKVLKDFSVPNAKPKFDDGISDTSDEEDEGNDESDDEVNQDQSQNDNESDASNKSEESNKKSKSKDKNNVKLVSNKNDESAEDDDDESSDDDSTDIKPEVKSKAKEKPKENGKKVEEKKAKKTEEDTILFQNSKEDSSDDDEEGSDEESEEDDEEEEEGSEIDLNNLNDLKESDAESDEEQEPEDVEKIGSFFDVDDGEGDKLKELLTGKTPAQQSSALQNLIKSYDPSLSEKNKDKLTKLFAYMLQYINDLFSDLKEESDVIKAFLVFDRLAPYFYDLSQTNKVSSKKYIAELLKEKYGQYKKRQKRVPDMDTLIFFKLISLLYPTSDFRHPITTPSMIFMTEILTTCRFNDAYSISRGLFVTTLLLEYTILSKRLVPSAINFLRGILYLSANVTVLNPIQVVPPFRLHKDSKILNLEEDCSKMDVEGKMAARDFTLTEINNDFKIRCFSTSMGILKEFFDYFNDIEAQVYLFEPHLKLVGRIDLDLYPAKVANRANQIVKYMRAGLEVKTFTPLTREKKRPKALRLYEPDIQEVFTGSKSAKLSREQAESQRLKTKYKKEMKGALREIRRDKSYIGSVKIRQKIHSDNIRKEKVKQIYKEASVQQGELNKLKRMK
ncbi:nucleolar protein 14 homolog [Spodoptera litura]|uniref:Nucleolar protein 14 homolog n=1 Tax=Spodoptera litura TaxID=69820 RepID=A0A9J7EAV5_SPOLT|nr:nucleolar protein 14 homolog [Spodoptera litura]